MGWPPRLVYLTLVCKTSLMGKKPTQVNRRKPARRMSERQVLVMSEKTTRWTPLVIAGKLKVMVRDKLTLADWIARLSPLSRKESMVLLHSKRIAHQCIFV